MPSPPDHPTPQVSPWRAVMRSTIAAIIGILPVLPLIADAIDIDTIPFVATILTVSAAATRVMAIPQFQHWLDRWAPWLAADLYHHRHESEKHD